jgi:hypothetical protein
VQPEIPLFRPLLLALLGALLLAPAACRRQPDRLEQALSRIDSDAPADRLTGFHDLADLLNAGDFQAPVASRHHGRSLAAYDARSAALRQQYDAAPAVCGSWAEQPPYRLLRYEAQLLIDLLGAVRTVEAEQRLRDAATLQDRRLQFFALSGLLTMGVEVHAAAVAEVAADDEMRNLLLEALQRSGRSAMFPEHLLEQQALARSDLVRWLTFPDELGCAPNQLEFIKAWPTASGDYFVFRFKAATIDPDAAADAAVWKAAMAGPWPASAQPTARPGAHTGSDYAHWETDTPEGHVTRMLRARSDAAAR